MAWRRRREAKCDHVSQIEQTLREVEQELQQEVLEDIKQRCLEKASERSEVFDDLLRHALQENHENTNFLGSQSLRSSSSHSANSGNGIGSQQFQNCSYLENRVLRECLTQERRQNELGNNCIFQVYTQQVPLSQQVTKFGPQDDPNHLNQNLNQNQGQNWQCQTQLQEEALISSYFGNSANRQLTNFFQNKKNSIKYLSSFIDVGMRNEYGSLLHFNRCAPLGFEHDSSYSILQCTGGPTPNPVIQERIMKARLKKHHQQLESFKQNGDCHSVPTSTRNGYRRRQALQIETDSLSNSQSNSGSYRLDSTETPAITKILYDSLTTPMSQQSSYYQPSPNFQSVYSPKTSLKLTENDSDTQRLQNCMIIKNHIEVVESQQQQEKQQKHAKTTVTESGDAPDQSANSDDQTYLESRRRPVSIVRRPTQLNLQTRSNIERNYGDGLQPLLLREKTLPSPSPRGSMVSPRGESSISSSLTPMTGDTDFKISSRSPTKSRVSFSLSGSSPNTNSIKSSLSPNIKDAVSPTMTLSNVTTVDNDSPGPSTGHIIDVQTPTIVSPKSSPTRRPSLRRRLSHQSQLEFNEEILGRLSCESNNSNTNSIGQRLSDGHSRSQSLILNQNQDQNPLSSEVSRSPTAEELGPGRSSTKSNTIRDILCMDRTA